MKRIALFMLAFAFTARAQTPPLFGVNAKYLGYGGTGGGTANAQTVTYAPAITVYTTGQIVSWLPSNANSGAATLNVNALGAKTIVKFGGAALISSDLTTTAIAFAVYDGTNFELQNPQTLPPAGSIACGGLPALTGDTTTSAGSCATTTAKINGTSFPTSATVIGSNGSAQPVSASTTGSGNVVLATSPTLTTPALGTPSALVLTNATSLPCGATPALTSDVTTSAGSCTTTVANVAGTAAATIKIRSFGTTFGDTAGSTLTSGSVVYMTINFACTIAAWDISVDAGTATIDLWKIATGTAVPTVTNTITASALPAISTGTSIHSTTLTGWTTSVAANDIVAFQLKTVSGVKFLSVSFQCNQ